VVIGAGTGLGVATLIFFRNEWKALPGEGGHADLAAVDDEERAAVEHIRRKHPRVKAEHVLSGPGLVRLYAACGGTQPLQGPAIVDAARSGDTAAQQAIRLFTRWLGRFAGNLALTLLAKGGVYIAGGIVPGWGASFDAALFRQGFEDKAPFASLLAQIPSFVITHPQPGLLGLARLASDDASQTADS
jgi:glucokinase